MRYVKLTLVVAVPLFAAGLASAQLPGGQPFGPAGLANMLGQNKQLQEELKLDKDQIEKLQAVLGKVREELQDQRAKLRDASPEERETLFAKMREISEKGVSSVLKPDQIKRLHQIQNQMEGLRLFTREDVQKDLKLSEEQKDKINDVRDRLQKQERELFTGRPGAGIDADVFKKARTLRDEAIDKAKKVLNDEQQVKFKDMLGEHFELTVGGFGGGFGGAGGAGGFGPGGPGGFPQPGQVLPPALQDRLKLTAEQKKQLEELQKDVDSKLDKILTDEQRKQLKELQPGRPGTPGAPPPSERPSPGR